MVISSSEIMCALVANTSKFLYPSARVKVLTLLLSRGRDGPNELVLPCWLNVVMLGDAGVAVTMHQSAAYGKFA